MNKKVSLAGKHLLKNTIRTVSYENRIQEEKLMSEVKEAVETHKHRDSRSRSSSSGTTASGAKNSFSTEGCSNSKNNYYLKKLCDAEERDPSRWGHSGFKELYPEEFSNTDSSDSLSSDTDDCGSNHTSKKRNRKRCSSTSSDNDATNKASHKLKSKKKAKKKSKKHKKHKKSKM